MQHRIVAADDHEAAVVVEHLEPEPVAVEIGRDGRVTKGDMLAAIEGLDESGAWTNRSVRYWSSAKGDIRARLGSCASSALISEANVSRPPCSV